MSFFVQFLQQLVSHQEEEKYALETLGFHTLPSIPVCSHLREFRHQNQRFPTLTELVSQLYEPCSLECDYYVPFTESIQIMEHVLVQYGFSVRCIVVHFIYMYQTLEHRYPTQEELFQYMEEHYHPSSSHQQLHEQQLNQMMADDVDHYWNHKQSAVEIPPVHPLSVSESAQSISCCICQDEIKEGEPVITLPCNHTFHSQHENCSGIESWIQKAGNCPLCKKPIHEEEEEEEEEHEEEIYNIINILANNLNFNEEKMDDVSFFVPSEDNMDVDEDNVDEEMPDLVSDEEDEEEYRDEENELDTDDDMPDLVSDEIIIEVSINLSHESDENSDDDN